MRHRLAESHGGIFGTVKPDRVGAPHRGVGGVVGLRCRRRAGGRLPSAVTERGRSRSTVTVLRCLGGGFEAGDLEGVSEAGQLQSTGFSSRRIPENAGAYGVM